jgi:uncharacterized protein (DUF58 family)
MRYLVTILLLTLFCATAQAASLEVTTTPAAVSVKRGETVTLTTTIKNTLVAKSATFTATLDYTDETGASQTATGGWTLAVKQQTTVGKLRIVVPALFGFVPDSATVSDAGPLTTASETGAVAFTLDRVLDAGQSLTVTFKAKAL